jgi:hypothetical protein
MMERILGWERRKLRDAASPPRGLSRSIPMTATSGPLLPCRNKSATVVAQLITLNVLSLDMALARSCVFIRALSAIKTRTDIRSFAAIETAPIKTPPDFEGVRKRGVGIALVRRSRILLTDDSRVKQFFSTTTDF